jgi:peptidoglycan/LPS O-acetylase OafA/YrhL
MVAFRLFLAMVVACDHAYYVVLPPQYAGVNLSWRLGFNAGYAVMFFYMISGFLICFALTEKYGFSRGGVMDFYKNRFVRIYSLYWPIALLGIIFSADTRALFWAGRGVDKFTNLMLFGADWNMSFSGYPVPFYAAVLADLGQAWTLGAELTFYLLAPMLLRKRAVLFCALAASGVVRAVSVYSFGFHTVWTFSFFPSTLIFFMVGAAANMAAQRYPMIRRWPLILGPVGLCSFFLMFPAYAYWDTVRFWCAAAVFALGLPALFHSTKDSRLLNFFGDLSYPVYLVHMFVISAFIGAGVTDRMLALLGPNAVLDVVLLFTAASAIVAHYAIERPIAKGMRALLNARPG